jgi:predicted MPP superfamily phosphohydrolase
MWSCTTAGPLWCSPASPTSLPTISIRRKRVIPPPGAGVKILLAHQPSTAAAAADSGYDVQISGHTHGGQFWPWNFFVRYFQPFTAGLNRLKNLSVYVSRGTGYWGPPNRFIVPAEITRIRLMPA